MLPTKKHLLRTKRGPIISSLFVTVFVFLTFLTSPAFPDYCVCECNFVNTSIDFTWASGADCDDIVPLCGQLHISISLQHRAYQLGRV